MKFKALVAALALAGAGSASLAATFNLGALGPPGVTVFGNSFSSNQNFSDTYTFSLNGAADTFGITWDADFLSKRDVDLTSISLTGNGLTLTDTTPYSFSFSNLLAGTYSLIVNGSVTSQSGLFSSGGYGGSLVTLKSEVAAPVPEPEAIAMMALGLGFVGFVARRRKNAAK